MDQPPKARRAGRWLLAVLTLAGSAALFALVRDSGWLARLDDQQQDHREAIEGLSAFGPLAVVLLLALAIVFSPMPTAPIVLAAGAAHGTVLTVTGATLGAVTAFLIVRFVAYDAVRRWELVRRPPDWLERDRSQNWLMAAVFLSRLAPFLSFDAISYAAGPTPLGFRRFLWPRWRGSRRSGFLAYGGEAALGGGSAALTLLAFGGVTGIPIVARLLWVHWRRRKA